MSKPKRDVVKGLTAGDCLEAIRERFPVREYALLEEVANGTGWSSRRWCDALALGLWPSRGMPLHGFEIKVSRSDWKRELEQPEKAESVASYCDHWHIVAPRGLIEVAELPKTWGLLEVDEKKKAHATVVAPPLEPKPLDRKFIAAILRRQSEAWDAALKSARYEAQQDAALKGSPEIAGRLEHTEFLLKDLNQKVEAFEKASGLNLRFGWHDPMKVGHAVAMLMNADSRTDAIGRLQTDARGLRHAAEQLEKEAMALQKIRANGEDSPRASADTEMP